MWLQKAIIQEIERQPTITFQALADLTQVGRSTVIRHINRLKALNVLIASGKRDKSYSINREEATKHGLL